MRRHTGAHIWYQRQRAIARGLRLWRSAIFIRDATGRDDWIARFGNRLNHKILPCSCRTCRLYHSLSKFRREKRDYYRRLDRYEDAKWLPAPSGEGAKR